MRPFASHNGVCLLGGGGNYVSFFYVRKSVFLIAGQSFRIVTQCAAFKHWTKHKNCTVCKPIYCLCIDMHPCQSNTFSFPKARRFGDGILQFLSYFTPIFSIPTPTFSLYLFTFSSAVHLLIKFTVDYLQENYWRISRVKSLSDFTALS